MIAIPSQMSKTSLLLTYFLRGVSAVMSLLLLAHTGIGQTVSLNGRQVFPPLKLPSLLPKYNRSMNFCCDIFISTSKQISPVFIQSYKFSDNIKSQMKYVSFIFADVPFRLLVLLISFCKFSSNLILVRYSHYYSSSMHEYRKLTLPTL